jgi:hypothetical protein
MATPPLSGPHVWTSKALLSSPNWGWRLSETHVAELDAAVSHAQSLAELTYTASGKPENLTPEQFPLPTLGAEIAALADELEHGTGAVLIRGVPVDRYGDSRALGVLLLGMFSHMGRWVNMSRVALSGEHVGHGEPFGKVAAATDQMSPEQKMSSRASLALDPSTSGLPSHSLLAARWPAANPEVDGSRFASADGFAWHTDRCDIAAVLCVRRAASGGASKVVSSAAVYNAMREAHPHALKELFQPYPWHWEVEAWTEPHHPYGPTASRPQPVRPALTPRTDRTGRVRPTGTLTP